jgi:GT2 family glycosyltransferase
MASSSVTASVIIPTHNRSDALIKTLSYLAKQDFGEEWEVIVVNNRCTDDTDELVRRQNFHAPLRLVHEQTPGAAAARNRGAREACGEILIFIDNDILVSTNFVRRHVETLRANPQCWFIGRVVNPPELRQSAFGRYRDDLHESYFRHLPTNSFADYDGATGQNWAMRKDEFFAAGGFDEGYAIASCEDAELALRARRKGFRTMFNPQSVVVHNDWATDLDSFCRRQEMYSISSVLLWKKYGENSFQKEIVKENSSVDPRNDSLKIIGKKIAKSVFASSPGKSLTKLACGAIEKIAPDTKLSYKAYRTAVALAMFRGVREGFRRYRDVKV